MRNADINPLISEIIHSRCEDPRMEKVIRDVLKEVLNYQYYRPTDSDKRFKRRYKELILANYGEDLESA